MAIPVSARSSECLNEPVDDETLPLALKPVLHLLGLRTDRNRILRRNKIPLVPQVEQSQWKGNGERLNACSKLAPLRGVSELAS